MIPRLGISSAWQSGAPRERGDDPSALEELGLKI